MPPRMADGNIRYLISSPGIVPTARASSIWWRRGVIYLGHDLRQVMSSELRSSLFAGGGRDHPAPQSEGVGQQRAAVHKRNGLW
jgi:hypothetical protein